MTAAPLAGFAQIPRITQKVGGLHTKSIEEEIMTIWIVPCALCGKHACMELAHKGCIQKEQILAETYGNIPSLYEWWEGYMPTEREKPFLTVIWLTKLLVGETSCEWAAWYKAHYQRTQIERVPSTFDFTEWSIKPTTLLNNLREDYERQGYTVTTEQQNTFFLRGKAATLSGTPDLVAVKGSEGVIIDAKTGQPNASHPVQVMVYMYAIPISLQQHKGITFSGHIGYDVPNEERSTTIPASAINESFTESLIGLIQRLADTTHPARKVPSVMECGFCDITQDQCPERAAGDERLVADTEEV